MSLCFNHFDSLNCAYQRLSWYSGYKNEKDVMLVMSRIIEKEDKKKISKSYTIIRCRGREMGGGHGIQQVSQKQTLVWFIKYQV